MSDQAVSEAWPPYQLNRRGASALVSVSIAACQALIDASYLEVGFSEVELSYALGGHRGAHALAARYAAKRCAESLTDLSWLSFEIHRSDEGAPTLVGRTEAARQALQRGHFSLSLTHDDPLALAYLVRGGSLKAR